MLSWASYLFGGSGTAEPEPAEASKEPTPIDADPKSEQEHDWVVVDYAAGKKGANVGMTDLENLLIEHPSMSVYKRSGSDGEDSNDSESSVEQEQLTVASKRSQVASRQAPHRARAVSARAQLMAQVDRIKVAQKMQTRQQTRQLNRKNTERSNKVAHCDKHKTRKNKVRCPSGRMNGRIPQRRQ